jgi:hypothetical protein
MTTTASRQTITYTHVFSLGAMGIDHPLDPQGKVLNQYTLCSPEMRLVYYGSAVIGSDGRASVNLPDYFAALCRNPMVQVSGVGTSDVFIADDVAGNRFVIGGRPGTKVYWTVTGERKDAVAAQGRTDLPVEQVKTGSLVGRSINGSWEYRGSSIERPEVDKSGKKE